ncbi:diphthine synthase [Bonamia ostreae]|uniref:diphthine methyl ester synthase n=1 Tax=Bonamia ostreae TaxID=126728 RepID=A0ABV2AIA4_9EUKA
MLYLIGLGLGDVKDITVRGLEAIKKCQFLYLDYYTSIFLSSAEEMSSFFGKKVVLADRNMIESSSDRILGDAVNGNVAFLVVGDPLGATTHTDLILRAKKKNISVNVVHNASIMNAIGSCGLQLYKFGQTVSIPFFDKNWRPKSFLDKIKSNLRNGLHTLCLLDIRIKEQSFENLAIGNDIYDPPRFMKIKDCINQIMDISKEENSLFNDSTKAIGVARLGHDDQLIKSGTFEQLKNFDFGKELHSLVIAGELDQIESEFFDTIKI